MKDETFAKVVKDNLVLLRAGEMPDKDIQFKYGKVINFLQTIVGLEQRLAELRGRGKSK
jgi:hypothetical protein